MQYYNPKLLTGIQITALLVCLALATGSPFRSVISLSKPNKKETYSLFL